MSTDKLDSRIHRAVTQVVETSPAPRPLEDFVAHRSRVKTARRRVVGAVVSAALVGTIVVLAAVVASRDSNRVESTKSPGRPPRIAATEPPPTKGRPTTTVPALVPVPGTSAPLTNPPASEPPSTEPPAPIGSLSAQLVLPSQTIAAGSSMSGTVIVENTGPPLRVPFCLNLFDVTLGNAAYQQVAANPACLQYMTVPAGSSSYPIRIIATYSECAPQPAPQTGLQPCLPDGGPPPLPPGSYRADLHPADLAGSAISFDPVTVTVV